MTRRTNIDFFIDENGHHKHTVNFMCLDTMDRGNFVFENTDDQVQSKLKKENLIYFKTYLIKFKTKMIWENQNG